MKPYLLLPDTFLEQHVLKFMSISWEWHVLDNKAWQPWTWPVIGRNNVSWSFEFTLASGPLCGRCIYAFIIKKQTSIIVVSFKVTRKAQTKISNRHSSYKLSALLYLMFQTSSVTTTWYLSIMLATIIGGERLLPSVVSTNNNHTISYDQKYVQIIHVIREHSHYNKSKSSSYLIQ